MTDAHWREQGQAGLYNIIPFLRHKRLLSTGQMDGQTGRRTDEWTRRRTDAPMDMISLRRSFVQVKKPRFAEQLCNEYLSV